MPSEVFGRALFPVLEWAWRYVNPPLQRRTQEGYLYAKKGPGSILYYIYLSHTEGYAGCHYCRYAVLGLFC